MNIQPIVFQVPSAPVAQTPVAARASLLPWVVVAVLVVFLAFSQFRSRDVVPPGPGPTPVPVVIDEAVASVVTKSSKDYAAQLGSVMSELASRVDAGTIKNWEQLSANARALSGPARERAFAPVDVLDTSKIPSGEWVENRSVVSAYLRSKAEGHKRAAK